MYLPFKLLPPPGQIIVGNHQPPTWAWWPNSSTVTLFLIITSSLTLHPWLLASDGNSVENGCPWLKMRESPAEPSNPSRREILNINLRLLAHLWFLVIPILLKLITDSKLFIFCKSSFIIEICYFNPKFLNLKLWSDPADRARIYLIWIS